MQPPQADGHQVSVALYLQGPNLSQQGVDYDGGPAGNYSKHYRYDKTGTDLTKGTITMNAPPSTILITYSRLKISHVNILLCPAGSFTKTLT